MRFANLACRQIDESVAMLHSIPGVRQSHRYSEYDQVEVRVVAPGKDVIQLGFWSVASLLEREPHHFEI